MAIISAKNINKSLKISQKAINSCQKNPEECFFVFFGKAGQKAGCFFQFPMS